MGRIRFGTVAVLGSLLLGGAAAVGHAQDGVNTRAFVLDFKASPASDLGRLPAVLRRLVTVKLDNAPLEEALRAVMAGAGVTIAYSRSVVPLRRRVSIDLQRATLANALRQVLQGTAVELWVATNGKMVLVPSGAENETAAQGTIVGRVVDAKTGDPLIGAEVWLEGTTLKKAASGEKGFYRLPDVPTGSYTLAARRVGYGKQTRNVTVTDDQEITVDIALQPVVTQLDELVTTVTGEQRLRELGHVVGRINADSAMKEAPVTTLSELLQSRVPGLQVFQGQGTVGGEVGLRLRGQTTVFLDPQPIVIVDGIRYTNTNATAKPTECSYCRGGDVQRDRRPFGVEPTSRLNDLNPNDIAAIEVVKGPSASTLYGPDAANGVIVITTKRGRPGPAQWSAYVRGSTTGPAAGTQQYPGTYWGWSHDPGTGQLNGFPCSLQYQARGWCVQDSVTVLPNLLNDKRWSMLAGSRPTWGTGVAVGGGREELRYYLSADLDRENGSLQMPAALAERLERVFGVATLRDEVLHPNTLRSLSARGNVDAALGPQAHVGVSVGYTQSATRSVKTDLYMRSFLRVPGDTLQPVNSEYYAAEQAFTESSTEDLERFTASVNGDARLTSWLSVSGTGGVDFSSSADRGVRRQGESSSYDQGQAADFRRRIRVYTANGTATASFRRNRFNFRSSLGAQYTRSLNDGLSTIGFGLPPGGETISSANSRTVLQNYSEATGFGTYLEQTIGLNDRLFVTSAVRADGSSTFGRNYNVALFPKVSFSWLLSEEPFMPRLPGLDEIRLRYAFGKASRQPTSQMLSGAFGFDQRLVNGQDRTIVQRGTLPNPDLRPERTQEQEFGMDAVVLAGRARLGLTWYRRAVNQQLFYVTYPPGFGATWTNIGKVTAHGFEADITSRVLDARAASFDLGFRYSYHSDKLISLGQASPFLSPLGGWKEGYPLGSSFRTPTVVGVADTVGGVADGVVVGSEVQFDPSTEFVGVLYPPRSMSLSGTLGLLDQRVRISALLDRQSGGIVLNNAHREQCSNNRCREVFDPNTSLLAQAIAISGVQGYYGERVAYTRLREVSVTFSLPATLLRAARLRDGTLSLQGRNLALWTNFTGTDPESIRGRGTVGSEAEEYTPGLPQSREWAVRFNVTF